MAAPWAAREQAVAAHLAGGDPPHVELATAGATAYLFCADWSREDVAQATSLDEARAFVADYSAARGPAFTKDERRSCGAWISRSVAYIAAADTPPASIQAIGKKPINT